MLLQEDGNVGIGTAAPGAPLEVVGGSTNNNDTANVLALTGSEHIRAIIDTSSTAGHQASLVLESNSNEVSIATTGSNEMRFNAGGSERVRINSNGNVGINVTDPDARLEIKGTGATTGLTFKTTDSVGNASFWIKDGGRVGVHYFPFVVNQDSTDTACPPNTLMYVHSASPFTIKTDGKVGIGATSPSAKLDVSSPAGTGVALAVKGGNNLVDNILLNLLNQSGTGVLNVRNNGALYGTAATFSGRIVGNDFEMLDSSGTGRTLVVRHSGNQVQFGDGSTFSIFRFNGTQVIPHADSTATLGTNALRWSTIYGDAGNFSEVMNLSGVNKIHQLSGHNFLQGDATMTYLYGGSGGGQIRTANNASSLIQWLDNGKVGIGTTAPSTKFQVHSGDILITSGKQLISTNSYTQAPGGMLTIQGPSVGNTTLSSNQWGIMIGPQHTQVFCRKHLLSGYCI